MAAEEQQQIQQLNLEDANAEEEDVEYVFREGDEEAMYIVVYLEGLHPLPKPGEHLVLRGLDTERPALELPSGALLEGTHDEAIGTVIVLQQQQHAANGAAAAAAAPPPEAAAGAAGAGSSQQGGSTAEGQQQQRDDRGIAAEEEEAQQQRPPELVHVCHTDKLLHFRMPGQADEG